VKKELALRHLLLSEMRLLAGRLVEHDHARATLDGLRQTVTVAHDHSEHAYRVTAHVSQGVASLNVNDDAFSFYLRGDGVKDGEGSLVVSNPGIANENARQARQLIKHLLEQAGAPLPDAMLSAEVLPVARSDRASWALRAVAMTTAGILVVATAAAWRASIPSLGSAAAALTLILGTAGMLLTIGVRWGVMPLLLAIPVAAAATATWTPTAVVLGSLLCLLSQWMLLTSEEYGASTAELSGAGLVAGLAVPVCPRLGIANLVFSIVALGLAWLLRPTRRIRPLAGFLGAAVLGTAIGHAGLRSVEGAAGATAGPAMSWLASALGVSGCVLGLVHWTIGTHRNILRMLLPFWIATMAWAGAGQASHVGLTAALAAIFLGLLATLFPPRPRVAAPVWAALTLAVAGLIAAFLMHAVTTVAEWNMVRLPYQSTADEKGTGR
jgi:hypothetical protein